MTTAEAGIFFLIAYVVTTIGTVLFLMPKLRKHAHREYSQEFPPMVIIDGMRVLLQHYYEVASQTGEAAAFSICFFRYFSEANKIEMVRDFGEFEIDKENRLVIFLKKRDTTAAAKKWQEMAY